jgi:hypothetical protein
MLFAPSWAPLFLSSIPRDFSSSRSGELQFRLVKDYRAWPLPPKEEAEGQESNRAGGPVALAWRLDRIAIWMTDDLAVATPSLGSPEPAG